MRERSVVEAEKDHGEIFLLCWWALLIAGKVSAPALFLQVFCSIILELLPWKHFYSLNRELSGVRTTLSSWVYYSCHQIQRCHVFLSLFISRGRWSFPIQNIIRLCSWASTFSDQSVEVTFWAVRSRAGVGVSPKQPRSLIHSKDFSDLLSPHLDEGLCTPSRSGKKGWRSACLVYFVFSYLLRGGKCTVESTISGSWVFSGLFGSEESNR